MKNKYLILLFPFLFILASCGKKKDHEEYKPYIDRMTNEDVSCYRVVTNGVFGYSYGEWQCRSDYVYLPK